VPATYEENGPTREKKGTLGKEKLGKTLNTRVKWKKFLVRVTDESLKKG